MGRLLLCIDPTCRRALTDRLSLRVWVRSQPDQGLEPVCVDLSLQAPLEVQTAGQLDVKRHTPSGTTATCSNRKLTVTKPWLSLIYGRSTHVRKAVLAIREEGARSVTQYIDGFLERLVQVLVIVEIVIDFDLHVRRHAHDFVLLAVR